MTGQKNKNRKRTLSRLIAVQVLYQYDFNSGERSCDEIKNNLVANYILDSNDEISSYEKEVDMNLLNKLITAPHVFDKIDKDISGFVQGDWTLERLDKVIINILRLATFELQVLTDIPAKVVIDEYVGIAASFFDQKKVTFVNALLDKISKKGLGLPKSITGE